MQEDNGVHSGTVILLHDVPAVFKKCNTYLPSGHHNSHNRVSNTVAKKREPSKYNNTCETLFKISSKNIEKCRRKRKIGPILVLSPIFSYICQYFNLKFLA